MECQQIVRRSSRPRKMVRRLVNEDDDVVPKRTVKKTTRDTSLSRRIKQEPQEVHSTKHVNFPSLVEQHVENGLNKAGTCWFQDEVAAADADADAPMTSPAADADAEAPAAAAAAEGDGEPAAPAPAPKEECDGHDSADSAAAEEAEDDANLPECKIKRNYSCPHCTYFTQNPRSYLYHLKDEHKEKIRVYECPNCLYASKHSQKLQRHVHMVHVMGRGKRKSSPRAPKPKAKKAAPDRDKESKPPPPALLPCADALEAEQEAPGEDSPPEGAPAAQGEPATDGDGNETYTCSQCPFSDPNKTLVARHEQAVHLRKKFFRCGKCNYVTHLRARYTKHVKYHSMPMIKCDMCDFRTPYKWNLDRHYKNHTGDGAFRCSLCNFTADIKQSLTVHEMNHHVPPAGAGAAAPPPRRRNKVGASDSAPPPAPADLPPPPQPPPLLQVPPPHLQASPATPTPLPPPPPLQHIPTLVSDIRSQLHSSQPSFEVSPFNPILGTSTPELQSSFDHSISDKRVGSSKVPSSGIIKRSPKIKITPKKGKVTSAQEHNERHDFQADFIHPDDIIHHKNGNVYIKTLKCKSCNFKAAWGGEMARHESKVHGTHTKLTPPKKVPRPIPNLIPIQPRASMPNASKPVPILKIPTIRARDFSTSFKHGVSPLSENALSEKDLNEICAKSCANSSLKDFASVIGDENAFSVSEEEKSKSWMDESHNNMWNEPHSIELRNNCFSESLTDLKFESSPVATMKKKSASFLDQIKEKLLIGPGDSSSLVCTFCNYECKCLSEFVRHEKQHNLGSNTALCVGGNSSSILSGTELSSTRCQHCRQRCKTSADLVIHLQSCTEANRYTKGSGEINLETSDDMCEMNGELALNEPYVDKQEKAHPMVNKVFVWNEFGQDAESDHNSQFTSDEMQEQEKMSVDNETEGCLQLDEDCKPSDNDAGLVGFETAPGYGAVSNTDDDGTPPSHSESSVTPGTPTAVKRVFKCPHCTFWASTASRFHVHIVGHLNKKPFECSLCAYRSNWRWDITKHIRLKAARDKNHADAKVLMTDETGRRNYSKYNKYLTVLRMREGPSTGSQQRLLPTPPRLIRAPTPPADGGPCITPGPLRPPPPLRAAHPMISTVLSQVRSQEAGVQRTASAQKRSASDASFTDKPPVEVKRTLWKCKKCNFRDASRELVLCHVKGHYQQRLLSQSGALGDTPVLKNNKDYSQPSKTEDTNQIIKNETHNEDVRVSTTETSLSASQETAVKQEKEDDLLRCPICPFITNLENSLEEHLENHTSQGVNDLKCTMCPYFVVDKSELLEHMKLHGVMDAESADGSGLHDMSIDKNSEEDENESSSLQMGADGSMCKRYRCANCPYLSNSKSQFLYHKQFHRPRGAPFKCGICSYNVTRRHLLHQHLRVHGILIPPQKSPTKSGKESQDDSADEQVQTSVSGDMKRSSGADHQLTSLDTSNLTQIPLVWVSRENKFFKMYKCRYCPHVNFRKANIQEHEKMHTDRTKDNNSNSDGGGKAQPSNNLVQHHCPECNYICNNAGVLSSHAKVHQGFYGQIHALVDPSKTDEAQLEELSAMVNLESDCQETNQPANNIKHEQTVHPDSNEGISEAADNAETSKKDENAKSDCSVLKDSVPTSDSAPRSLYFCSRCPARFLVEKELKIHRRYHILSLPHLCEFCSYAAKQRAYLLSHMKVHTDEYQEKTDMLLEMYGSCQEYPRPQIAVDNSGSANAIWVVIDESGKKDSRVDSRGAEKHYTCGRCPAKFLKSDSLHYHISMHGGQGQYKCKFCDYTAKTFGHLIKHENVHQDKLFPLGPPVPTSNKVSPENGSDCKTYPQPDVCDQNTDSQRCGSLQAASKDRPQLHVDPQFGILMHGNPDFIYPTYLKNGRLKEKRYKCHKCPSAFEKREQYRTHLSLHGAKQRYRCEKCDYSVKYYANYIQHMRKHKDNDDAKAARLVEKKKCDLELLDIKVEITEPEQETEPEPALATESVPVSEVESQLRQQQDPETEQETVQEPEQETVKEPKQEIEQEPEQETEQEPEPETEQEPEQETEPEPETEPETTTEPGVLLQPEETVNSAGSHSTKSIGSPKKPGPIKMSVADRQILMLMQMKHAESLKSSQETVKEQLQKSYWCPNCPYSTPRRDDLEIHIGKHASASGTQSAYPCDYCDYSVPSIKFLREHHQLHFAQKRFATECFMKSRCIQIWRQDIGEIDGAEISKDHEDCEKSGKHLVFKDRGISVETQDRFEPLLPEESALVNMDINEEKKVVIDLNTGDPIDMEVNYQESGDTNMSSPDSGKLSEELDLETKEAEMNGDIPHELTCVIKQELPDSEYAEDDSSSIVDGTIQSTEYIQNVKDVCIS